MLDVRRIHSTMSTNTMDARCKFFNSYQYNQVLKNKSFFLEAYLIKIKLDASEGLDKFVR